MAHCIPKIIHLLVKDKEVMPTYYSEIRATLPDWEIRLYDDLDIRSFMQVYYPDFMAAFCRFPMAIQRLDIFRMLIVHLFGGFYMDADVDLYKSLDDLLYCEMVLGEEKTLTPTEMALPHHKYELRIANYMFGAVPKHAFLLDFAKKALDNNAQPILSENDILETTGPGLLTNFYHESGRAYGSLTLLKNEQLTCTRHCSTQPACHFGNYAAHHHHGSWRWQ